jgi:hypothetical protein
VGRRLWFEGLVVCNRKPRVERCGAFLFLRWEIRVKGVCLGADCFAFGDLLLKSNKSKQKCLLLVGFLLRRNTLTPTTLRGPAPNGHPCPDGALAASMRLGPLRIIYVRPAPKSRFAGTGLFAYEDQKQIRSKASRLTPVPQGVRGVLFSGTGFSREGASVDGGRFAGRTTYLWERACSRMLLIVPTLCVGMQPVTLRVHLR